MNQMDQSVQLSQIDKPVQISHFSLLNTDYKIATKSIAATIAKVLPSLIHEDQSGYIKGRFIDQNIRLTADIIECTKR